MPKFDQLSFGEKDAIVAFLKETGKGVQLDLEEIGLSFSNNIPWLSSGHHPIKDDGGFPINKRPWGTLSAIDMDCGKIGWQVLLGTYRYI